jgi:hypothetical protein
MTAGGVAPQPDPTRIGSEIPGVLDGPIDES